MGMGWLVLQNGKSIGYVPHKKGQEDGGDDTQETTWVVVKMYHFPEQVDWVVSHKIGQEKSSGQEQNEKRYGGVVEWCCSQTRSDR